MPDFYPSLLYITPEKGIIRHGFYSLENKVKQPAGRYFKGIFLLLNQKTDGPAIPSLVLFPFAEGHHVPQVDVLVHGRTGIGNIMFQKGQQN